MSLNLTNDYDYLVCGDCLEVMTQIPDGSVDMILCDLPYGTTQNKWDTVIPLEPLWAEYKRVIKDNGAIVLFSAEPFTSRLVQSNLKMFRYDLIWSKKMTSGFLNANRMPLRAHENILVFYKRLPAYKPMFRSGKPYTRKAGAKSNNYGSYHATMINNDGTRHPTSIISITQERGGLHPTQKPVPLLEYLIKTYTNEGETVLDNCMGSGSTCVACVNTGRHYIGIEKEPEYFEIAKQRIAEAQTRKEAGL